MLSVNIIISTRYKFSRNLNFNWIFDKVIDIMNLIEYDLERDPGKFLKAMYKEKL